MFWSRESIARLPPDLIWLDWVLGRKAQLRQALRKRPLAVYRYNLLDHIGTKSSFSVRVDRPSFPKCFDPMAKVWSIHSNERFQVHSSILFFSASYMPMMYFCPVQLLSSSVAQACRFQVNSDAWNLQPLIPMIVLHERIQCATSAASPQRVM